MPDISHLSGITWNEAMKLRRVGLETVEAFERFVALGDDSFVYRIAVLANLSRIWKPERLIELIPPEKLPVKELPEVWLERLMARLLREAKPEETWLRRCRSGLQRVWLNMKGHWRGWRENFGLLLLFSAMLMLLVLGFRAAGLMKWLPSPLGLRHYALVTTRNLREGQVLKQSDLGVLLLPPEQDYFKATDQLEGLKLSSSVEAQRPLRFKAVSRLQVLAKVDIHADAIIKEADLELKWSPYQPDALVGVGPVVGRKAQYEIQQGTIIPCFVLNPAPCG